MKRASVLVAAFVVAIGMAGCSMLGGNNVSRYNGDYDGFYPDEEETSYYDTDDNSELFRVVSDAEQSSVSREGSEGSGNASSRQSEASAEESGELFRVVSDVSKSQTSRSQTSKSQTSKSQTSRSQTSKSQTSKSQTSKSQTSKSQTSKSQTSKSQTSGVQTSSKPSETSRQEHSPEPSSQPSRPSTPSQVQESSREPSSTVSVPVTHESSEPSQIPAQDDQEMLNSLYRAGYELGDLEAIGCRQLITVNSSGSSAVISFYEKNSSGLWEKESSLTTNGFVGSQGVSSYSYEGSRQTPFGLYGVGDAFYIYDQPQTGLSTFRVTEDTYWVDDPDSAYYNRLVEGTDDKDWNSAEHMIDYAQYYKYGFVIEFNTYDPIPGKGSAIFFHVNDHATAGCVATSEPMVLAYLRRLDRGQNPQILIQ